MKIELTYSDETEQEPLEIGNSIIDYAKNFFDLYMDFKKRTDF